MKIFIYTLVACAIALGPLLTIWALNTLFPVLNILYNIHTWFAVIVVCSIFKASSK